MRELLNKRADDIAREWLRRVRLDLPAERNRVFAADELLRRMPEILRALSAGIVAADADEAPARAQIAALAELRRAQGYALDELVREFEALRAVVFDTVLDAYGGDDATVRADVAIAVTARLERLLAALSDETARQFERQRSAVHGARAELLARFGRALLHDVRNRLNSAVLSLRVLRDVPQSETARRELIGRIEDSLSRISAATSDVFMALHADRRATAVGGGVQRLDEIVERVVHDVREVASARGVELRVAGNVPHGWVDAARIELALTNLIISAVKHRDVEKDECWIELRFEAADGDRAWRVVVADNGVGVAADLAQRVFDPETRAEGRMVEGEGLGLSLARDALAQIDAAIAVDSRPGEGSELAFVAREPWTAPTAGR